MLTLFSCLLLLLDCLAGHPVKKETISLSYAPAAAKVIYEQQKHLFRAPLCKGMHIDSWSFHLKVYLQSVQWDSREVGDSNWLRIRVSNRDDMTNILCDNAAPGIEEPANSCPAFTYSKAKWGEDDLYIEITASTGTPTYQYGLHLEARQQGPDKAPEATANAKRSVSKESNLIAERLEQAAVPYQSNLMAGQTGQYKIPYCFEGPHILQQLTTTTMVLGSVNTGPGGSIKTGAGGVASFFCSTGMMVNDECFRSMVCDQGRTWGMGVGRTMKGSLTSDWIERQTAEYRDPTVPSSKKTGPSYYDSSGAKINTISPDIIMEEYGPVYLLVLAQGGWRKQVYFTITAKLKNADETKLLVSEKHEADVKAVISFLEKRIDSSSSLQ